MTARSQLERLQKLLKETLAPKLPGVEVEVTPPARWKRPVAVVRWGGFAGLLAEQRFRVVVSNIPAETFERDFHGLIWFELTPGEEIDDYLRMPRSDDVAKKAESLMASAMKSGLAGKIKEALGNDAKESCSGSFEETRRVLAGAGWSKARIEEFCLAAVGRGAYCDCEVIALLIPESAT